MEKAVERGLDWAGLPVIATVARLLCREPTLQNEYLRPENRILTEKVSGRIRFTDEERQTLAEAALAMDRSLMKEVVSIVKPDGAPPLAIILPSNRPVSFPGRTDELSDSTRSYGRPAHAAGPIRMRRHLPSSRSRVIGHDGSTSYCDALLCGPQNSSPKRVKIM
ncbi:MAG: hypothetical protein MUQ65_03280 [Armatimonadetes bacterium]|nr:hypothetical protein [Armatimonadota bacterium]